MQEREQDQEQELAEARHQLAEARAREQDLERRLAEASADNRDLERSLMEASATSRANPHGATRAREGERRRGRQSVALLAEGLPHDVDPPLDTPWPRSQMAAEVPRWVAVYQHRNSSVQLIAV